MSSISEHIHNKGTGAGGKNTNVSGKNVEDFVRNIGDKNFTVSSNITKDKNIYQIQKGNLRSKFDEYIRAPENAFKKLENTPKYRTHLYPRRCVHPNIIPLHGCINPDELYINTDANVINWIECKNQNKNGSTCEKLQTFQFKIENLQERFPGYRINYIYILARYFEKLCKGELSNMKKKEIHYLFVDDPELSSKLLDCIQ